VDSQHCQFSKSRISLAALRSPGLDPAKEMQFIRSCASGGISASRHSTKVIQKSEKALRVCGVLWEVTALLRGKTWEIAWPENSHHFPNNPRKSLPPPRGIATIPQIRH
jgi:hypothetical protein